MTTYSEEDESRTADEISEEVYDRWRETEAQRRLEQASREIFHVGSEVPAYCVYEKRWSKLIDPKSFSLKNGMPGIEGTCSSCHRKIARIGTLD